MAFFPLSNINEVNGFCEVHNYPPNDWENTSAGPKHLWGIYSNGKNWIAKEICSLNVGESRRVDYKYFNLKNYKNNSPLVVLQMREQPLEKYIDELPKHEFLYTKSPEWRATVGFKFRNSETSYQGEINAFPPKASLLTFHPFIQYNKIENYFVFINLESTPIFRSSQIEIYNSNDKKLIDIVDVKSNSTNIIPLDKYNIKQDQLPVFICRDMAGIPFGFGLNRTAPMLSLEHTHPPASFVVNGNRFETQKIIKTNWFNILK